MSHKPSRNESNHYSAPKVRSSPERSESLDQVRFNKLCSVHKQTRGNTLPSVMLSGVGTVAVCHSKQYCNQSSSHCGQRQCCFRRAQWHKSQTDRVESMSRSSTEKFSSLGHSEHRSVCINTQPQNTDILFMDTPPTSISNRCTVDILGESVRILLPTNMLNSEDFATYETVSLQGDTDNTILAKMPLVSKPFGVSSSTTSTATCVPEIVKSTPDTNLTSKSGGIQPSCMATIDGRLRAEGFSKRVRILLRASWRAGTQKDYTTKFRKFNSWCSKRKIDTYSASLRDCAEFPTYLYHDEGLQYRTIAGYRSMSVVLPTVDKFPVGQHPHIIRLLKVYLI